MFHLITDVSKLQALADLAGRRAEAAEEAGHYALAEIERADEALARERIRTLEATE